MTTVIVAEKPSVARDLARVVGASARREGYLEGNGYRITWALGHLVHFAAPDDYGPAWAGRWSLAQLPMIPERWRLRGEPATAAQFEIVKALLNDAQTTRIVCATDAGREGELIFRLIHEQAGCARPFERLWISSLTATAIQAGLRALRPGSDFDALAAAARARAQADWLVGMNLTRAYSARNGLLCTIGRVQTPTLAMIVARDTAIAAFTRALYYELHARFAEGFSARYNQDGATRIDDRASALQLKERLTPFRTGSIARLDIQVRQQRPPPLYDLTNLQRDANRRFGHTAARALELAQTLYETHKLISYPRTESRHLGEDMLSTLPGILAALDHPLAPAALRRLNDGFKLGTAYVDRTRLTDHHAIIPTGQRPPAALAAPQRQLYDLIVARFVAIFLPDREIEDTEVDVRIDDAIFSARGARELVTGWKAVEPGRRAPDAVTAAASDPDGDRPLPPLTLGQRVHVECLDVVEKETQPPRPFDDASLLAAMKGAGREIEDEALAKAMRDSGLGTPATRAEIIEKLIRTGYCERQRKQLRSTDKGRALIGLVADSLRSPELTARWERQLKDIECGAGDAAAFQAAIHRFVADLVPRVATGPALSAEQRAASAVARPSAKRPRAARSERTDPSDGDRAGGLGRCPRCGQGDIVANARAYGCSRFRDGCTLTIWKTLAGHRLTEAEVRALLRDGQTGRIEAFRSKAGKPFAARLRLDAEGRVAFDFSADRPPTDRATDNATATDTGVPAPAGPRCPRCGLGRIIQGRRGFGCDRYREGCDFVIWRDIGGLSLEFEQIRALIEDGCTAAIDGFSDASGRRYRARLYLDARTGVRVESEIEPETARDP